MQKKIAVIIGSLRKESWSRKVSKEFLRLTPESLEMKIIEIGDIPHYNEDLDNSEKIPETWVRFRNEMKFFDSVLFVTPEYNRSIPGTLKNAIDVGLALRNKVFGQEK